jgi:hypothetical protein
MLWKEASIKELALNVTREQLPVLLADPKVKSALFLHLLEMLGTNDAKPLAEKVTFEVRAMIEKLQGQFERAIKTEQKKISEQKAEILDKTKEEIRLSIIAQKSHSTRQINQYIEAQEETLRISVMRMEEHFNVAIDEAEKRIIDKQSEGLDEFAKRLDELLEERLYEFASEAVMRHLKKRPLFGHELTNRGIAALNGISIREVKRRRRALRDQDHNFS